jgi:hypothetical protein
VPASSLALSPSGLVVAAAAPGTRALHVWSSADGAHRVLDLDSEVSSLLFLDEELLAVGQPNGVVRVIHLPSFGGWSLTGHRTRVIALAVQGRTLTSLSEDGVRRTWPPVPPADHAELRGWLDTVTRARFDAEDRLR